MHLAILRSTRFCCKASTSTNLKSRQTTTFAIRALFTGTSKLSKTGYRMADAETSNAEAQEVDKQPEPLSNIVSNDGRLLWIDCEMTGLDFENDKIIEIAAVVTDAELEPLDRGCEIIIKTPNWVLDNMHPWCIEQHGKSGLTEACRNSTTHMVEAEDAVIDYVTRHMPEDRIILAGSSVHADKAFLRKDMPRLHALLSYRILDVSSVRECVARWYPSTPKRRWDRPHEDAHRARDDIFASIAELRYLRKAAFK